MSSAEEAFYHFTELVSIEKSSNIWMTLEVQKKIGESFKSVNITKLTTAELPVSSCLHTMQEATRSRSKAVKNRHFGSDFNEFSNEKSYPFMLAWFAANNVS